MKYQALATDYDGTLAHDGRVDEATIDALRRARAAGLHLVMVTGRELADLLGIFAHADLFEQVVVENGAVLYAPASRELKTLAMAPPPAFIEMLTRQSVPLAVGRSIVATVEPFQHQVLAAIRALDLDWHVVFNKGSVMALPSRVTKATGLSAALDTIGVAAARTAAVGDAENDQELLLACGLAAAVSNALPSLKELADVVTAGARGAGVVELIDRLLAGTLDSVAEDRRAAR